MPSAFSRGRYKSGMNIVDASFRLEAGATRTLMVCPRLTRADGSGLPFSSNVMIRSGKAPTRSPSTSASMYSLTKSRVVPLGPVRPILSVLIVGSFVLNASTLEEFGLALFLGLLSGAYSSIFIATPLLALLKEREPRYRDLRRQIAERGHGSVVEQEKVSVSSDPVMESVVGLGPGGTPRPRKPGKR